MCVGEIGHALLSTHLTWNPVGCVAQFLTGPGPVPVCGPGVGGPLAYGNITQDSLFPVRKAEDLVERVDALTSLLGGPNCEDVCLYLAS